ncbi:MAG: DUF2155 domain-containing protein [Xanthobacteraceae bacterium]
MAAADIRMIRIAALVLAIGGTLVAGPAMAQFNLFGGGPPRPPADIPNGSFPQQPAAPPYPDYPGQTQPGYPNQTPSAYPSQAQPAYPVSPPSSAAIESQPLPPPPGAAMAPVPRPPQPAYPQPPSQQQPLLPARRAVTIVPPANAPAPPANAPSPPVAAAPAQPEVDTVVERPTAHIENRRAVFAGLDKITGRTFTFDAAIGETVKFGALEVTPRACYTRPPTEETNTDAFVEVDEVTLQGEIKRIFTGWMFASSPGLNAVEHPIYDVWLTNCSSPIETSSAEPVVQPASIPKPRRAVPARRRERPQPSSRPLN